MYNRKDVFSTMIATVAEMTHAVVTLSPGFGYTTCVTIRSQNHGALVLSLHELLIKVENQLGQTMLMKITRMGHMDNGIRTVAMISIIRNAPWLTFLRIVRISLSYQVNRDRAHCE